MMDCSCAPVDNFVMLKDGGIVVGSNLLQILITINSLMRLLMHVDFLVISNIRRQCVLIN